MLDHVPDHVLDHMIIDLMTTALHKSIKNFNFYLNYILIQALNLKN